MTVLAFEHAQRCSYSVSVTAIATLLLLTGLITELQAANDCTTINFVGAPSLCAGKFPYGIQVADFNRDHRADLALKDQQGHSAGKLYLGNGDGTFSLLSVLDTFDQFAIGDLNRDGIPDIIGSRMEKLTVILGKGDGTFLEPTVYLVPFPQRPIFVGDINNDTWPDVVLSAQYSWNGGKWQFGIYVMLGASDGTLKGPVKNMPYDFGDDGTNWPIGYSVVDLNNDGNLDIAMARGYGGITIALSNGDGTFQAAQNISVRSEGFFSAVKAADVNGDGITDLITTDENGDDYSCHVFVLLGKGDGTFRVGGEFRTGLSPKDLVVADLNNDGKIDLVTANLSDNTITVLLGNGDGTFQQPKPFGVGLHPSSLALGDFNGDAKPDLAVTNLYTDNVSILFGDGNGSFSPQLTYSTNGKTPYSVAKGDFNRDGKVDLAATNRDSGDVSIFIGRGDGTFHSAVNYPVRTNDDTYALPYQVAVSDLNGDGFEDLLIGEGAKGGSFTVKLLLGNGDGTFQQPRRIQAASGPASLIVGDFNGDGKKDFATANYWSNNVSILVGNGDGTFKNPVNYPSNGTGPRSIAKGDFNRDGILDLVFVNYDSNNAVILLGNGDGTFHVFTSYSIGNMPRDVVVSDLNLDGKDDLVIGYWGSKFVSVLLGNGDGSFQSPANFHTPWYSYHVAAGDLNGDGVPDLVVADGLSSTISVMLGKGDGSFPGFASYPMGGLADSLALGDFDADGKLDIAAVDQWSGFVRVFLTRCSSCPPISLIPSSLPSGIAGTAYYSYFSACNAIQPVNFSITGGTLPPGLTFSPDGGLTGTLKFDHNSKFAISATGAFGCKGSQVYSVSVPSSSLNLSLPALGVDSITTLANTTSTEAGYAVLNTNSGSPPYATAVLSLSQNGIVVAEVGVPPSAPTQHGRIFIDYRSGVVSKNNELKTGKIYINTGMALVNRGSGTAHITFTLLDGTGNLVPGAFGTGTLASGSHVALFIDQLPGFAIGFSVPSDFSTTTKFGSLDISSDQPLSILALRLTNNQRGETLLTSTPTADAARGPSSDPLYFPQVADGGGYTTTIFLMNNTPLLETGSLRFHNNDGTPLSMRLRLPSGLSATPSFPYSIQPGGLAVFQTDGSPGLVNAGSVQLIPDSGMSTPIGSGLLSFSQAGILITESGVPSATPTTHARIYIDTSDGHNTGLAISNVSASSMTVTLAAFQTNGLTPAGNSNGPIHLSGNGHSAKFVGEFIAGLPSGFTGVLDISSAQPFAALTLRLLNNLRGDTLLTTFPIADFNQRPVSPLVFPQIAEGGGYHTQFIILNTSTDPSTMTLAFSGDGGSPLMVGKTAVDR